MANRNISATVQIGATMSATVGAVFGRLGKQIESLGSSLAKIKKQSSEITRLQTAQGKLAEAKAKGSAAAVKRYSEQVEKLSASLKAAGVDTSNLSSEQARLASSIARSEARMSSMTRIGAGMNRIRAATTGVGTAFANVRGHVMGLTTKMTALGAVTGYVFKTQFVDTAAEFERLQTVLKTMERGDVGKAKQSFGWINEFAAKTPYDLKLVTEAFVKLRQYGIDPIKGDTLRILGDTASGGGKDLLQGVEALADAVVGQYQRLKEFAGIDVDQKGENAIIKYTDALGKMQTKIIDKNNKELIRSTLLAIWNSKYAGAMDEQSRTWKGMMSNMGDQWTRFTSSVMAAGLFDWMKTEVGGILDELNKAAADGRLQTWAKQTGTAIKEAFISLKDFAVEAKSAVVAVKDFVGGWKSLGVILGAVMLAPTIASLGSLALAIGNVVIQVGALIGPSIITGLVTLGTTMKALAVASWAAVGPWGALAAGIVAVGAVIYTFKDEILDLIDSAINPLINALREIGAWFSDSRVGKMFGLDKYNLDGTPQSGKAPVDALVPFRSNEAMKTDLMRSIMPTENMPAPGRTNNVKQDFQINVTAPSSNPAAVGEAVKSALKSMKLYDETGTLVPQ